MFADSVAVPFALAVDVPANTTYNVSYNFALNTKADAGGGSYSAAVTNGACNNSALITTPAATGNILDAKWMNGTQYQTGHMTGIDEMIVGVDHNPSWGSECAEGKEYNRSDSMVFTFMNNTSETVTFVRYFCLNVVRFATSEQESKDFYAKMTVSTDYIRVVRDVDSLNENGSVSIAGFSRSFNGNSLNYGVLNGYAYKGTDKTRYLTPGEGLSVKSIYQSSYINSYPGLINGDTVRFTGLYNMYYIYLKGTEATLWLDETSGYIYIYAYFYGDNGGQYSNYLITWDPETIAPYVEDPTAIKGIEAKAEQGVMYNIFGQQTKEAKGFVVKDGVKMMVK